MEAQLYPQNISSAGQLLMCPPRNSGSTLCLSFQPKHGLLLLIFMTRSTGRRQGNGLKSKGRLFCFNSSKCALNTDSCSDTSAFLLSEVCKGAREEGLESATFS